MCPHASSFSPHGGCRCLKGQIPSVQSSVEEDEGHRGLVSAAACREAVCKLSWAHPLALSISRDFPGCSPTEAEEGVLHSEPLSVCGCPWAPTLHTHCSHARCRLGQAPSWSLLPRNEGLSPVSEACEGSLAFSNLSFY